MVSYILTEEEQERLGLSQQIEEMRVTRRARLQREGEDAKAKTNSGSVQDKFSKSAENQAEIDSYLETRLVDAIENLKQSLGYDSRKSLVVPALDSEKPKVNHTADEACIIVDFLEKYIKPCVEQKKNAFAVLDILQNVYMRIDVGANGDWTVQFGEGKKEEFGLFSSDSLEHRLRQNIRQYYGVGKLSHVLGRLGDHLSSSNEGLNLKFRSWRMAPGASDSAPSGP